MSAPRPDRFGPYRIEEVLGRGAMGVVYRAVDERDGRPAAVKTVAEELLAGDEAESVVDRFRREAEIGRRLRHPGIVRVFDHGETAGLLYLAMELVEGRELKAAAGAAPGPPAQAVRIARQLLDALGYAHSQGVVHRDVKLSNIFLRPDGQVKLMDFGIAHLAGSDLTRTGDLLGSPSFMAPEQVRGERVDARTDLFAAGVVLYALLAGRRPFLGNVAAVMHQILTQDPPPPSQANPACPPALDAALARALAKRPEDRWADAAAFAAALDRALGGAVAQDADAEADTTVALPPPAPEAADEPGAEDRLAALLEACLGDAVTERRLAEAAGLSERMAASAAGAAALRRAAEAALPDLAARILTSFPAPGDDRPPPRADWGASVRLFARLQGHAEAGADLRRRIARELSGACLGYAGRLNGLLFTEAEPDVARISMDLLRLDVLQLALEDLGAEAEADRARQALRGFAGQVVAKANALIGGYLAGGDALARFSVANLLVSVEDLIGIADRLFDYAEDDPAAADAAADAVGEAAIAEFADKAARLVELVVERALADLSEPRRDGGDFAHGLDQVGYVYLFATRLRDPRCREALAGLVRRTRSALRRLGDAASAGLTEALAAAPRGVAEDGPEAARVRAAFGRISALIALAERLGWAELRARLMADLRARLTGDPSIARLAARSA
jgi:serine/threonine-protein kinase